MAYLLSILFRPAAYESLEYLAVILAHPLSLVKFGLRPSTQP